MVLISQGSTETYPDYLDPRLACLQTSINLAIAENLQVNLVFVRAVCGQGSQNLLVVSYFSLV